MKLADYPDNWGPTLEHMLQNWDGFNASDYEKAAKVAKSVGDLKFAELLLELAAKRAVIHLEAWGHLG